MPVGHISGGHYNPAVSIAATIRGALRRSELLPYMAAQAVGAIFASGAVVFLKGVPVVKALEPALLPALLAEFLFTFALCYVVLNVATAKSTSGNSFYGWAIGFTVMTGAFAVGSISGGAFNPAVALGLVILKLVPLASIWIYLVAELAAAVVAAVIFLLVNGRE